MCHWCKVLDFVHWYFFIQDWTQFTVIVCELRDDLEILWLGLKRGSSLDWSLLIRRQIWMKMDIQCDVPKTVNCSWYRLHHVCSQLLSGHVHQMTNFRSCDVLVQMLLIMPSFLSLSHVFVLFLEFSIASSVRILCVFNFDLHLTFLCTQSLGMLMYYSVLLVLLTNIF